MKIPTKYKLIVRKKKNYVMVPLISALIGSIFWNKNIPCHDTFNKFDLRLLATTYLPSDTVSVLGQEEGYMVKYNPPPEGVPKFPS